MLPPFTEAGNDYAAEIERKRQQTLLAYKQTFAGGAGALVLEDLKRKFGFDMPTAQPGVAMEEVYRRECMKHPIYHIIFQMNETLEPEAKPTKAKS